MASIGLRLTAGTSRAARLTSACTHARRVRSRNLHGRKELSYPIENGLGEFLPSHTLKMIAVDYQQGLLDRLNDQVKGTSLENKSVVQTVVEAARDPDKVLEFNYACEALNNSFFLESLKPPPADATSHEAALSTEIFFHNLRVTWGTLSHLKSCFSAAVLGMFSSGYVWLVCDQFGSLGILPTFGAGTLLVRSGLSQVTADYQKVVGEFILRSTKAAHPDNAPPASSPQSPSGASSEPAPTSPASGLSHAPPPLNPHTPARSFSSTLSPHVVQPRAASVYKTGDSRPPILDGDHFRGMNVGELLYPLLCVSVHEHAWVSAGYGVWGKEEYMKRFWTVVDWKKVCDAYTRIIPDTRYRV